MGDDFPADVRRFIDQHIESLAQLEVLLLLRQEPERKWELADIAKTLYITDEMAGSLLADFVRRGFAQKLPDGDSCYRYRIPDGETDALIEKLAALYRERRVAVISLIYSKPLNKVQTLADAFRFGKENPR
jgi:DNA-binding MarR family transcriptional regulator